MTKHIIAISILLLGLSTHISAQNRSDEEILAGLPAIGVVVKFGNADGLDIAKQPATLQKLQDRARELLKQEGVPLLESTDELDMMGRPRLVFTVTLNKKTDTAPAILVESSIYEGVRLWRDESKELELATWVRSGIGVPTVTQEMLFDVFEGQINSFVKAYRAANPNPTQVVTANAPAQFIDNPNTLEGLSGTRFFVSFRSDPFGSLRTQELLKTLQSEAEEKLKQAGISLLRYTDETERAGRPLLYVFITLSGPNSSRSPIEIESKFWQRVRPVRDPRKAVDAVTWESNAAEGGPITDDAVLQVMNNQLDEFIKAFTAANPKLAGQLLQRISSLLSERCKAEGRMDLAAIRQRQRRARHERQVVPDQE